jgi:hypothetical protein
MAKAKKAAVKKPTPTQRAVKAAGVAGVNKPKLTPSHPTKKAVVVTKVDGKPKTIRFGDQSMGHNYSPEARKAFKSRHAKNIARGPSSPAYWADKFLWAGPSGKKKTPPKTQKKVHGKPKK